MPFPFHWPKRFTLSKGQLREKCNIVIFLSSLNRRSLHNSSTFHLHFPPRPRLCGNEVPRYGYERHLATQFAVLVLVSPTSSPIPTYLGTNTEINTNTVTQIPHKPQLTIHTKTIQVSLSLPKTKTKETYAGTFALSKHPPPDPAITVSFVPSCLSCLGTQQNLIVHP